MSHSVLIADHSSTTRAMIMRIITSCGIDPARVFQAADGKEALDVLDSNDVDLVLADLQMPGMGGMEFSQRLQVDPTLRHVPVVIVSADPNVGSAEELKQLGVRGCLAKPFTPESFRDVLGQVLGARAHAA